MPEVPRVRDVPGGGAHLQPGLRPREAAQVGEEEDNEEEEAVTAEQKDRAGEVQWLSGVVHNVDNAADTKRFAIALAKRGAERLKEL